MISRISFRYVRNGISEINAIAWFHFVLFHLFNDYFMLFRLYFILFRFNFLISFPASWGHGNSLMLVRVKIARSE